MSQTTASPRPIIAAELPHTVECGRCSGRGTIPMYGHVEGGICFACRGAKRLVVRG